MFNVEMFTHFLGYEGAILKQPCRLTRINKLQGQQPQGPVAFLSFTTRKDAEGAKEKFQGFHLDPHTENITLKIEFAKVCIAPTSPQ